MAPVTRPHSLVWAALALWGSVSWANPGSVPRGFLLPIGGGASTGNENRLKEAHIAIHRQAVAVLDEHRAQGAAAGSAVCTLEYRTMDAETQLGIDINQQLFEAAGVASNRLKSAFVSSREQADSERVMKNLEDCGLFYIPGGNQTEIVTLWQGTRLQTLLRRTLQVGGGIMGKSAGAAVQGTLLFLPGPESATSTAAFLEKVELRPDELRRTFIADVLPQFPKLYVETHTGDRERSARALAVLAYADASRRAGELRALSLAVDSDTGVLIRYNESLDSWTGRVIGARAVEFMIPDQRSSSRIDAWGQASYTEMPSSVLLDGMEMGLSGRFQGTPVNNKSMDGPFASVVSPTRAVNHCYRDIPRTVSGEVTEDSRLASEVAFYVRDPLTQEKQDLNTVEYGYLNGAMQIERGTGCGYWQTQAFSRSQGLPENRLNVQRYALGVGQADFTVSLPNTMKADSRFDSQRGGTCIRFLPLESDISSSVYVIDARRVQQRFVSRYVYEEFGARAPTQVGGWLAGRVHLLAPFQELCLNQQQ